MPSSPDIPNGARFRRCALQVNPFAYLQRHGKPSASQFDSEEQYNAAIVAACKTNGIEVIAVTDHYRIADSVSLVEAARKEGIKAFTGFEAATKDGVHFLCLVDQSKGYSLERIIGDCGILNPEAESPTGKFDALEFLERAKEWGAICIAAHVTSGSGLLMNLSGQARANAWKSENLLACAIPGAIDETQEGIQAILKNKDPQYKRSRMLAIVNAADVNGPGDMGKNAASCFLKMSEVSVEGLRQAFLDPQSRIRLHSDPSPESHAELVAMTWEGGFLDEVSIRFNENLNVLIGGRGAGKSTIIESIRYVLGLEPLGTDARKIHDSVVKRVLRPGTKVSLRVHSHQPSSRHYLIERSVPNPPVVKNENGDVLEISPHDVMPGVEVFGQHEISDLANEQQQLTRLLMRFADHDQDLSDEKSDVQRKLDLSRGRVLEIRQEMERLSEQLSALPGLEETQTRFQEAGLEEKFKDKSLIVREERIFSTLHERLGQYRTIHDDLKESLPIDTAFVSSKALSGLPNMGSMKDIEKSLDELSEQLSAVSAQFGKILKQASAAFDETEARWKEQCKIIDRTYEELLREFQKSDVQGDEFIRLRRRVEGLRPLKDKMQGLSRDLAEQERQRKSLLSAWDDIKSREYRCIEKAARRISKELKNRVRVTTTMAGDRSQLERLLRNEVGGNLNVAIDRLQSLETLSLQELAHSCRDGKAALLKHFCIPSGAAERMAGAGRDFFMKIEELDLQAKTEVNLNIAPEGTVPEWRPLSDLSTGQKATAILLLLFLESQEPLIVDQPEDDLDNRFITEGIVPIMREEKRRRQFIFSTHNANIPVLGDSELILGLVAEGEHAKIAPEHMGSLDSKPIRDLVEEVLEGGRQAFEMRQLKYGF